MFCESDSDLQKWMITQCNLLVIFSVSDKDFLSLKVLVFAGFQQQVNVFDLNQCGISTFQINQNSVDSFISNINDLSIFVFMDKQKWTFVLWKPIANCIKKVVAKEQILTFESFTVIYVGISNANETVIFPQFSEIF